MNIGLLIIGIFFLVIAFLFLFLGGWERFKLERKDDLWLVVFILGWIVLAFAIIFIVWAILSNKKKSLTYSDYESYYPFDMNNEMMMNMPSIPNSTGYLASNIQNTILNKNQNNYQSVPQRSFPNPFASPAFSFLSPSTSSTVPSMTKSTNFLPYNSTTPSNSPQSTIFSNYKQGISMFE